MAYQTLVPCPVCERHVRASDRACPFCDAAISPELAARVVPLPRERLDRAKIAAFGAAASLALAACGQTVGNGTGGDSAVPDAPVSRDARVEEGGATDAGAPPDVRNPCTNGIVPAYGLPPPPSCDAGGPDDNGGSVAEYGGPFPEPDAGVAPPYGIPPSDGG